MAGNNNNSNENFKSSGSSSKKKSGNKKSSALSNEAVNDAVALARAIDDRDIHPRSILTGFYGARGERIRHIVQDGCLQMPQDALTDIEIVTQASTADAVDTSHGVSSLSSSGKTKTYALPGLDSVFRPLLDPKVENLKVVELMIEKVMVPKSVLSSHDELGLDGERPPSTEPEMIKVTRCAAKNRVIRRHIAGTDWNKKSGAERIRGGGGDGEQQKEEEGHAMIIDVDEPEPVLPTAEPSEPSSLGDAIGVEPPTTRPSDHTETSQPLLTSQAPAHVQVPLVEQTSSVSTSRDGGPVATMEYVNTSSIADGNPIPMDLDSATVAPLGAPAMTKHLNAMEPVELDNMVPTDAPASSTLPTHSPHSINSIPVGGVPSTTNANSEANSFRAVETPAAPAQSMGLLSQGTLTNLATSTSAEQPANALGITNVASDLVTASRVETATAVQFDASVVATNLQQGPTQQIEQQLMNTDGMITESNFFDLSIPAAASITSPEPIESAPNAPSVPLHQQQMGLPLETSEFPRAPSPPPASTVPAFTASASIRTTTPIAAPSAPAGGTEAKIAADNVPSTDPSPKSMHEVTETHIKPDINPDAFFLADQDVPPARALKSKPDPQWEQHKPASADEMITAPDQMAPRPDWYKKNEVADIERSMLPEWFDSSAPHRTPESYLKAREKVVEMSDALGNRNVTNAMIRRVVAGDAGSLQRLRSFLVHWGIINQDAINDSAPTPASLRSELKTPKRFSDDLRGDLIVAVIQQAKRRKLNDENMEVESQSPSLVVIDWDEVAKVVGHGASAEDCQRNFLATPLKDESSFTLTVSDRPITPDGTQEESKQTSFDTASKETIVKEFIQDLVDRTDPEFLQKVVTVAMEETNGNLQESQAASLLALQMTRAIEEARGHEVDLAVRLSKLVDTRMQKLENRMVMMDDIEGILEAEKVALELERRDLYTARCRHWFGGA